MFQNSYQNGTFFDLFDPKASQDKTKNLYKLQNTPGNNKIFDKQLKTYIFEFNSGSSRISFPKQQRKDLYLIQQFLNLHIYFYQSMSWSIELYISDLTKTKRRVVLSSAGKQQNKPFFVKFPCAHVQEGVWTNLSVDLYSFIAAFKGQTYRSLDMIVMTGHFKLRRIFTTQQPFIASYNNQESKTTISLLPKVYYFSPQVQCSNCMITYEDENHIGEQIEDNELITKSRTNTSSRHQVSTPKTATIKQQKPFEDEKKFLANTNGPQKNRKKPREKSLGATDKSRYTEKININKQKKQESSGKSSTQKYIRSSLDKKTAIKQQKKKQVKNKVNPWRSTKKNESQTDGQSQFSETKPINNRKVESAQTTLFKTNNKLASKFNDSKKDFDHRSDQYSDSDYVQLSQKFSTVTDGKFFKNELHSQYVEQHGEKQQEQIQQNIQFEDKQMCESTNRKKQNDIIKQLKNQQIDQSINDSLDNLTKGCSNMLKTKKQTDYKIQPSMMNSYYGFGEKLMNKYMGQLQRPYSPPLGDREPTEQASEKNDGQGDKQVQLIYDPVLNCYYDHKTHTYYELKN